MSARDWTGAADCRLFALFPVVRRVLRLSALLFCSHRAGAPGARPPRTPLPPAPRRPRHAPAALHPLPACKVRRCLRRAAGEDAAAVSGRQARRRLRRAAPGPEARLPPRHGEEVRRVGPVGVRRRRGPPEERGLASPRGKETKQRGAAGGELLLTTRPAPPPGPRPPTGVPLLRAQAPGAAVRGALPRDREEHRVRA